MSKSDGTTGTPNGLLHKVHFRTDLLQFFSLFFSEVMLGLLFQSQNIHKAPLASSPQMGWHFVQHLGLISISLSCICMNHRRNHNPQMRKNLISLYGSKFLTYIISLLPEELLFKHFLPGWSTGNKLPQFLLIWESLYLSFTFER